MIITEEQFRRRKAARKAQLSPFRRLLAAPLDRSNKRAVEAEQRNALRRAVNNGYYNWSTFQRALQECEAGVNSILGDGVQSFTPLTLAITTRLSYGAYLVRAIVEKLIEAGADVNLSDGMGMTPLHHAVCEKQLDTVHVLMQHGADVNLPNHFGETALHYALFIGYPDIISLLLSYHPNVNAKIPSSRSTPLHLACGRNDQGTIYRLLLKGADPLCRDDCGRLPIHIACEDRLLQHNIRVMVAVDTFKLPVLPQRGRNFYRYAGLMNNQGVPPDHRDRTRQSLASIDQNGDLPLHVCFKYGVPLVFAEQVANLYPGIEETRNAWGDWLVLAAATGGSLSPLDVIYFLLRRCPNVVTTTRTTL